MQQRSMVTDGAEFIGTNFVLLLGAHQKTLVVNMDTLTYAENLGNLTALDELNPLPGPHSHASLIRFVDDRPGFDWCYAINSQRLKQGLQWLLRTGVMTGICRAVRRYLSHLDWVRQV